MVTRICEVCGVPFEAQRSSAMYCSNKCKMRKRRLERRQRLKYRPVFPEGPPEVPAVPVPADCEAAVLDAHRVANDLGRLAAAAPYQLQARFARVSSAIFRALEEEGL